MISMMIIIKSKSEKARDKLDYLPEFLPDYTHLPDICKNIPFPLTKTTMKFTNQKGKPIPKINHFNARR